MVRRKLNPGIFVKPVIYLGIAVVLSGIGVFFFLGNTSSLAKFPPFPVQSYMDGGNLWSDEHYALEGKVENVLLRADDRTKYLISIRPKGSDFVLPVIIEKETSGGSLVRREQKLLLKVHLGTDGEIRCTDVE
jgi:hypothetical protein